MHLIATADIRYQTAHNLDFESDVRDRATSRNPSSTAQHDNEGDLSFAELHLGVDFRYQKNLTFHVSIVVVTFLYARGVTATMAWTQGPCRPGIPQARAALASLPRRRRAARRARADYQKGLRPCQPAQAAGAPGPVSGASDMSLQPPRGTPFTQRGRPCYCANDASNACASCKSLVSNPSVNQL